MTFLQVSLDKNMDNSTEKYTDLILFYLSPCIHMLKRVHLSTLKIARAVQWLTFGLLCTFTINLSSFAVAKRPLIDSLSLRATWWSDPSTTMVIGWNDSMLQPAVFEFDTRKHWLKTGQLRSHIQVSVPRKKKDAYWVQLTQLSPQTAYQFRIRFAHGQSREYWFETAPNRPTSFTLVAGGDSRNHRSVRQDANRKVAQLRPLAVLFGGDFTAGDRTREWKAWFEDWQLSISSDGRITPLIPARGNHDSESKLARGWGNPFPHFYYDLAFGGSFVKVYTLNSERPAGGDQAEWLKTRSSF